MQRIDQIAASLIETGARDIYSALMAAHRAEPVIDIASRTAQLQELFTGQLMGLGQALNDMRMERTRGTQQTLQRIVELPEAPNALDRSLIEYRASIQIAVTEIANAGQAATIVNNTNTFHATVGAFQTGANSTATVTQTIATPPGADAVKAALDDVIEALRIERRMNADQQREVIESLRALKAETEKDKPNSITIRGLLGAVGTVVPSVPSAVSAFDALKRLFPP